LDELAKSGGLRRVDLARRLEREGQPKLALEVLAEAQGEPGVSGDVILLRARLEESLGRTKEAYATLTRVSRAGTPADLFDVNLRRARLLAGPLGQPERALGVLDTLLAEPRLRPRHDEIRLERAETEVRLGRWRAAVSTLRALSAASRDEVTRERATFLVGELFFHQGEIDSAAAAYLRQVEQFPKGSLTNDALARVYLFNENFGDSGESLRDLGRVAELEARGLLTDALALARSLEPKYAASTMHDDLLWKLALLMVASSDLGGAQATVDSLVAKHGESRLAPQALKLKGEIQEGLIPPGPRPSGASVSTVPDRQAALRTYEMLLDRYPGTIEASEVRPRVSAMRKEFPS
jgi:tetratricopeptide (TPR) repeat protein